MALPLHSFERIPTTEASAGDLVCMYNGWWLRLENEEGEDKRGLILSGPDAGKIGKWPVANGIRIAHGNGWQVLAKIGLAATGKLPAVSIGEEGVTFHGHEWHIPQMQSSFTTLGQETLSRREPWEYISTFSIWLTDDDGKPFGTEPVFTVGE